MTELKQIEIEEWLIEGKTKLAEDIKEFE